MRVTNSLFIAALLLGLANPASAQTDPQSPAMTEAPANEAVRPAPPPVQNAGQRCQDVEMMQPADEAMPMMQMHMAMMQMQMKMMQRMRMQDDTMMPRTRAGGSSQTQMMEMMRSMQMMQMDMLRMMQQMQNDTSASPAMGATP